MQAVIQLFLLCLGVMMFKVEMKYRLAILVFSMICLREVIITFIPFGQASYFLSNCFFLSCLYGWREHVALVKQTVIYMLMLMMLAATVFLVIYSPHYHSLFQVARLAEFEFVAKNLVIAMVFLCITEEKELSVTVKAAFVGILILTAIGWLNYKTMTSFWVNMFSSQEDGGSKYMYSERFRVQAMFHNPFDYGFICVVMACFFFYAWRKGLMKMKMFVVAQLCCLFGTYTCECRTVHVSYLLAVFVYIISAFKLSKVLTWAVAIGIVAIIVVPSLPGYNDYMRLFEKALETNTAYMEGGSSIAMRVVQFTTVLHYIQDHMIFGRGLDYFNIDLGWADVKDGYEAQESDLWGLEGAYLNKLLERGFFGLIVYVLFYLVLFIKAFTLRHADPMLFGLFTSVLAVYFFFAQATGDLYSVFPTMVILGFSLKLLYVKSDKLVLPQSKPKPRRRAHNAADSQVEFWQRTRGVGGQKEED